MIEEKEFFKNKKVLITGASGFVGEHLCKKLSGECKVLAGTFFTNSVSINGAQLIPVDLRDGKAVDRLFRDLSPDVIFHCASITRVDFCENEPESAEAGIIQVLENLLSSRENFTPSARMITLSTDMVFNGEDAPYSESDQANPISCYGKLKAKADKLFLSKKAGTILRPALIYGLPATHHGSFLSWMVQGLLNGQELTLFSDEYRTPVLVDDLIEVMITASMKSADSVPELINVGGCQRLNRVEMGEILCDELDVSKSLIKPIEISGSEFEKTRPKDLSLDCALLNQTFDRSNKSFIMGIKSIFSELEQNHES